MAIERIKVNLIPTGTMPVCHASQYDKGRKIGLDIYNGLQPYILSDETVELDIRKSDGRIVTLDVPVMARGNSVVFETTEQMCAVAGANLCELRLLKNGTDVGSANFSMQIERSPMENGLHSESEINNLNRQIDDYLDEVLPDEIAEEVPAIVEQVVGENYPTRQEVNQALEGKADATATAEALNSLAEAVRGKADVSAIPTKTSQLQNDSNFASIDDSATASDKTWSAEKVSTELSGKANTVITHNDVYSFERGFVSTSGGLIGDNNKRARTPLIKIVENELNNSLFFTCDAPSTIYTFKVCAFYKNGVFVKNLTSSDYKASGTTVALDGTFNQFRLCFSLVNDTQDMTDAQVEALSTTITTNISLETVKDDDNSNAERIESLEKTDYADILENTPILYDDTYSFERGFVSTSGGTIGYNTKRARTPLLNIVENEFNDKLVFSCNAPSTVYTFKVCAFYKDGVFVKNLPSADYNASGTIVDLDGTFNQFRVCFSLKNDTQDMTDAQVEALSVTVTTNVTLSTVKSDTDNNTKRIEVLEEKVDVPNLWYKGKKCVALGDSITYGYAPKNYDLFGQQLDSYAKLASQRMGMSFVNYGIAGSTVAYHADRDPMSVRYANMDNDADVILVMGGTNDIRNGISLGVISDRTNTTFYGALHVLLGGLYKKYMIDQGVEVGKTKKIVICTPIKLLQTGSEESGGTGTLVDFSAWIDAIKEVASYYSFPVLDLYNQSNINPHLNETIAGTEVGYIGYYYNPYITDGTHPTQEGQDIMADVLCGFLMSLVS